MSTRCNIEIYDGFEKSPGAMLYHHSDGYPSFMEGKLDRFLKAAYEYLTEAGYSYWWDSERVAAVLVALSIEDYTNPLKPFSTDRNNKYGCKARTEAVEGKADYDAEYRPDGGVPVFQPCLRLHSDIEFVWRVYLDTNGEFTVKCFKAIHGANWESVAVGSEVDLTKNENEEFENDDDENDYEGEDEDEHRISPPPFLKMPHLKTLFPSDDRIA